MRVVETDDREPGAATCRDCGSWYWHKDDCRAGRSRAVNWDRVADALDVLSEEFVGLSREKGWWGPESFREDGRPTDDVLARELALVHSEVSEALDEVRNGRRDRWTGPDGKPEGFGVELADTIIRALLLVKFDGQRAGDLIRDKHRYNQTRPHRHGGKRF